jgi:hypothetical protein
VGPEDLAELRIDDELERAGGPADCERVRVCAELGETDGDLESPGGRVRLGEAELVDGKGSPSYERRRASPRRRGRRTRMQVLRFGVRI